MRHPLDAAFAVLAFIIGSFLAFYGGDYASRMMKALGGPLRGYANASSRVIALLYWPCCLTSGSSPSP
jgi:hypothetical protein